LTAARLLRRRALLWLAAGCLGLTCLSFLLTPHGDLHAGSINFAISLTAIVMVAWLVINMEAARDAAQGYANQAQDIVDSSDIGALQTALDGKAAVDHTHPIMAVVNLQSELDGKAPINHGHAWDTLTGIPAAFPPATHTHPVAEIIGLQAALAEKRASRFFFNQL